MVLLAGNTITLYYQLNQSQVSAKNLTAEILTELRAAIGEPTSENVQRNQQAEYSE